MSTLFSTQEFVNQYGNRKSRLTGNYFDMVKSYLNLSIKTSLAQIRQKACAAEERM